MVRRTESAFDGSRVGAENHAEPIDGHRIESAFRMERRDDTVEKWLHEPRQVAW